MNHRLTKGSRLIMAALGKHVVPNLKGQIIPWYPLHKFHGSCHDCAQSCMRHNRNLIQLRRLCTVDTIYHNKGIPPIATNSQDYFYFILDRQLRAQAIQSQRIVNRYATPFFNQAYHNSNNDISEESNCCTVSYSTPSVSHQTTHGEPVREDDLKFAPLSNN